jgi:hypothetical protein
MTIDKFYDLLVPLVLVAVIWAIVQCFRVVKRNGARVYLNKFGLFLLCYGAIVYTLNLLDILPDTQMTFWLRPFNFALFLLLGSLYKTERRSKW